MNHPMEQKREVVRMLGRVLEAEEQETQHIRRVQRTSVARRAARGVILSFSFQGKRKEEIVEQLSSVLNMSKEDAVKAYGTWEAGEVD